MTAFASHKLFIVIVLGAALALIAQTAVFTGIGTFWAWFGLLVGSEVIAFLIVGLLDGVLARLAKVRNQQGQYHKRDPKGQE